MRELLSLPVEFLTRHLFVTMNDKADGAGASVGEGDPEEARVSLRPWWWWKLIPSLSLAALTSWPHTCYAVWEPQRQGGQDL